MKTAIRFGVVGVVLVFAIAAASACGRSETQSPAAPSAGQSQALSIGTAPLSGGAQSTPAARSLLPAVPPPSVGSTGLELKALTNSCAVTQVQDFFQIINHGTTAVPLSS